MQLFLVSWEFESSEEQVFASEALIDYFENGEADQYIEGYERIQWVHTPQDGTGVVICKAANAYVLYKVFNPWREKFGITWTYKPALTTQELIQLLKEKD